MGIGSLPRTGSHLHNAKKHLPSQRRQVLFFTNKNRDEYSLLAFAQQDIQ